MASALATTVKTTSGLPAPIKPPRAPGTVGGPASARGAQCPRRPLGATGTLRPLTRPLTRVLGESWLVPSRVRAAQVAQGAGVTPVSPARRGGGRYRRDAPRVSPPVFRARPLPRLRASCCRASGGGARASTGPRPARITGMDYALCLEARSLIDGWRRNAKRECARPVLMYMGREFCKSAWVLDFQQQYYTTSREPPIHAHASLVISLPESALP